MGGGHVDKAQGREHVPSLHRERFSNFQTSKKQQAIKKSAKTIYWLNI